MKPIDSLTIQQLANVSGGYDWNRAVDNGVRWGSAGALAGAGVGVFCGAGLFSGEGAGIGGALGGLGGLAGGTAYDLRQQYLEAHASKAGTASPAPAAK